MTKQKGETPIVKRAMQELPVRYFGSIWVRVNSGRRGGISFSSMKLPDLIGLQKFGGAAVCEVKTKEGRLLPHQYATLREVGKRGALSILYTPDEIYNWDEIPARYLPAKEKAAST